MAGNWWYNLVAHKLNLDHVRLVCETTTQKLRIEELEKQVKTLTDDAAIIAAGVRERFRQGNISGRDTAAMNLLREALHREKAYTLFLEDSLECKNPNEVFDALPIEKRKEYFDKVQ